MDPGPSLRDIGCFAQVARELSFSRASVALGLSQPAVSQAVARLERVLGSRLFERTSREVQLTDAGKILLPYAEALLDQVTAFTAEADRLARPDSQAIRLAYCPLVGTLAARVARRLARHAPPIDVELRPAGWTAATAGLDRGVVSVALMNTPFPAGTANTARFHVPVGHLAVPAGDPLATAARLSLDQLGRREILIPRGLAGQLTARLRPARLAPDDLDDLPAAVDLVAAGRGLLPAPHLLVETVRRPDVRFVPLDAGDLRLTYGLVWRTDRASANLLAIVHIVQELLRAR